MKLGIRRAPRLDSGQFHARGRPNSDHEWAVTCTFCGTSSGRAFNVTTRGFCWTCATCARTQMIVLPPSPADDQPASVVLWQLRDRSGARLAAVFVLRPGVGLELRVERGRTGIVSEVFRDPDALLTRSSDIRHQLLSQGCSIVVPAV